MKREGSRNFIAKVLLGAIMGSLFLVFSFDLVFAQPSWHNITGWAYIYNYDPGQSGQLTNPWISLNSKNPGDSSPEISLDAGETETFGPSTCSGDQTTPDCWYRVIVNTGDDKDDIKKGEFRGFGWHYAEKVDTFGVPTPDGKNTEGYVWFNYREAVSSGSVPFPPEPVPPENGIYGESYLQRPSFVDLDTPGSCKTVVSEGTVSRQCLVKGWLYFPKWANPWIQMSSGFADISNSSTFNDLSKPPSNNPLGVQTNWGTYYDEKTGSLLGIAYNDQVGVIQFNPQLFATDALVGAHLSVTGDVYSEGKINVPTGLPYDQGGNGLIESFSSAVVRAGGNIRRFNSFKNWIAKNTGHNISSSSEFSGQGLVNENVNVRRITGIAKPLDSCLKLVNLLQDNTKPLTGVYLVTNCNEIDAPLVNVIDRNLIYKTNATFIFQNGLTIKDNINANVNNPSSDSPLLGFIALNGDVDIDINVNKINYAFFYIPNGIFRISGEACAFSPLPCGKTPVDFILKGFIMAKEFLRTNTRRLASINLIYDGRATFNPPPGFSFIIPPKWGK